MAEPLVGPPALSEPDRSERISGINPEVTYQCGKGHTTTKGLNVVCDRPFFAVSKPRGCRPTDHFAHGLTDLDRHLQERHRLDGPGSRRIGQTAAQREGNNSDAATVRDGAPIIRDCKKGGRENFLQNDSPRHFFSQSVATTTS
jgi:hypothetical protein